MTEGFDDDGPAPGLLDGSALRFASAPVPALQAKNVCVAGLSDARNWPLLADQAFVEVFPQILRRPSVGLNLCLPMLTRA